MSRTIDMTPTWPEAARLLLAVLENGTDEGKALARAEIQRMADLLHQMQQEARAADETPTDESQP